MSDINLDYAALRRAKRITQVELASAVGISQSLISKFEKGERNLNTNHLLSYKNFINTY